MYNAYFLLHFSSKPQKIIMIKVGTIPQYDDPILLFSIASFDMMSGIRVLDTYNYSSSCKAISNDTLNMTFRMVISNVHRQDEECFFNNNFLVKKIDLKELDLLIFNSIFLIKKTKDVYYSVELVLKRCDDFLKMPLVDTFSEVMKELATATRNLLIRNEGLNSLKSFVDKKVNDLNVCLNSGIWELPKLNFIVVDQPFFSTCLTSHFQTQMRTIIELNTNEGNKTSDLKNFLCHFLLDYQLRLSSFNILQVPNPYLYLQIVEKQTAPIEEILIEFPKPCTWIRLQEKQVFQSPNTEIYLNIHSDFLNSSLMNDIDDPEIKRKLSKIKQQFKITTVNNPTKITNNIISTINDNSKAKDFICEQKLNSLVKMSLILISLTNSLLKKTGTYPIPIETTPGFFKMLKINNKHDALLIINIAQNSDPMILKKLGINKKNQLQFK